MDRILHGVDLAIYACAASGWSLESRRQLRSELLTLRTNLVRYFASVRNDARRLDAEQAADLLPAGQRHWETERLITEAALLAARLEARGDDREEMYRIRDAWEHLDRELRDLDVNSEDVPDGADEPPAFVDEPKRPSWLDRLQVFRIR